MRGKSSRTIEFVWRAMLADPLQVRFGQDSAAHLRTQARYRLLPGARAIRAAGAARGRFDSVRILTFKSFLRQRVGLTV